MCSTQTLLNTKSDFAQVGGGGGHLDCPTGGRDTGVGGGVGNGGSGQQHALNKVRWASDGRKLITGDSMGNVSLYQVRNKPINTSKYL